MSEAPAKGGSIWNQPLGWRTFFGTLKRILVTIIVLILLWNLVIPALWVSVFPGSANSCPAGYTQLYNPAPGEYVGYWCSNDGGYTVYRPSQFPGYAYQGSTLGERLGSNLQAFATNLLGGIAGIFGAAGPALENAAVAMFPGVAQLVGIGLTILVLIMLGQVVTSPKKKEEKKKDEKAH